MLGIRPIGNALEIDKSAVFPTWVADLKARYSVTKTKKEKIDRGDKTKIAGTKKSKRELSCHGLKEILQHMPKDEAYEENYKKLVLFYILDQFLLPSSEKVHVRSKIFKPVKDLDSFEEINWAKAILDHIHKKANNIAIAKEKNFTACTPILEAMMFERIPKLQPKQIRKYVSPMPVLFKYGSRRGGAHWSTIVEGLTQSDVSF